MGGFHFIIKFKDRYCSDEFKALGVEASTAEQHIMLSGQVMINPGLLVQKQQRSQSLLLVRSAFMIQLLSKR